MKIFELFTIFEWKNQIDVQSFCFILNSKLKQEVFILKLLKFVINIFFISLLNCHFIDNTLCTCTYRILIDCRMTLLISVFQSFFLFWKTEAGPGTLFLLLFYNTSCIIQICCNWDQVFKLRSRGKMDVFLLRLLQNGR